MLLRSPSSKKLQLLKRDLAARELAAKEEMLTAIVEPPTEPRCPKTKPWGALLALQLARCEGRGRAIVHLCCNYYFLKTNTFGVYARPCVGPCAGD